MFERDNEWKPFRRLITDRTLPAEDIAVNTHIPLDIVVGFREQHMGRSFLDTHGDHIPQRLRRHAVGFRYARLDRWINTPAEMQARDDYDAGLTEVCQGKFKVNGADAYVLFSIPRRIIKKGRPLYFSAPSMS